METSFTYYQEITPRPLILYLSLSLLAVNRAGEPLSQKPPFLNSSLIQGSATNGGLFICLETASHNQSLLVESKGGFSDTYLEEELQDRVVAAVACGGI